MNHAGREPGKELEKKHHNGDRAMKGRSTARRRWVRQVAASDTVGPWRPGWEFANHFKWEAN